MTRAFVQKWRLSWSLSFAPVEAVSPCFALSSGQNVDRRQVKFAVCRRVGYLIGIDCAERRGRQSRGHSAARVLLL